ncbi:MAG: electron transfer flavoprotein beta subunit [Ilumatobacteraceae bacterium]|jgi:electron transfer flavoprotein beta subunit
MIAVCLKWIGEAAVSGVSAADEAAVEMALRHGESIGSSVIAVTVGGAAADHCLRQALACGVKAAVRVDASEPLDSPAVAAALSPVVAHTTAVWCGDYSTDRGTGSVPAFLAALLDRQQALGVVGVEFIDPLRVTRRLDGGRREVLRVTGPSVLSVEGSVARLRRASLRAALSAQTADVLQYGTPLASTATTSAYVVQRYRPRARVLTAPKGVTALDRLRVLTDASAAPQPGEIVEASPPDAARRIIEVLGDWGYLTH